MRGVLLRECEAVGFTFRIQIPGNKKASRSTTDHPPRTASKSHKHAAHKASKSNTKHEATPDTDNEAPEEGGAGTTAPESDEATPPPTTIAVVVPPVEDQSRFKSRSCHDLPCLLLLLIAIGGMVRKE